MPTLRLDKSDLARYFSLLSESFNKPIDFYLIGETSHVWDDVRDWTTQIEFTATFEAEDRRDFASSVEAVGRETGFPIILESPEDVIPLPDGYEGRCFEARVQLGDLIPSAGPVRILHFDPYSVAFRFIARGDEPDYHIVLTSLGAGWINEEELEALLVGLLPKFSKQTIQQDPAEFRRKYKGLMQMWRAGGRPRVTHRFTSA